MLFTMSAQPPCIKNMDTYRRLRKREWVPGSCALSLCLSAPRMSLNVQNCPNMSAQLRSFQEMPRCVRMRTKRDVFKVGALVAVAYCTVHHDHLSFPERRKSLLAAHVQRTALFLDNVRYNMSTCGLTTV
jgi:hypothetical protein